jgi:hypothetical protein
MEVTLHKLSGAKLSQLNLYGLFPIHIQVGSPHVISKETMLL